MLCLWVAIPASCGVGLKEPTHADLPRQAEGSIPTSCGVGLKVRIWFNQRGFVPLAVPTSCGVGLKEAAREDVGDAEGM